MIKFLPGVFRNLLRPALITPLQYKFCAEFIPDPTIDHLGDMTIRQHRRMFLNRSVMNQSKDVVFGELRKNTDSIIALKDKGLCPGVIETMSGEEVDVVLPGKIIRQHSKSQKFPVVHLYLRVEGRQFRCIFHRCSIHNDGFIYQSFFREYVPGQPNKIVVPIELTHFTSNAMIMRRGNLTQKMERVAIVCYNEEFPSRFYIDVSFANPDRPYRVGDLANTLPPGVVIDPSVSMNDRIATIIEENKRQRSMRDEVIKELVEKNKKSKEVKPGQAAPGTPGAAGTEAGKDGKAPGGATTPAPGDKTAGGADKAAGGAKGKK